MVNIAPMAAVIGGIVAPLYLLLIWLIRSYSAMNRGIGELAKDVERNTNKIAEVSKSVDEVVDEVIRLWKG